MIITSVITALIWGGTGWIFGGMETESKYADLIGKGQKYEQVLNDLASLGIEYKKQSDVMAEYEKELGKSKNSIVSISKSSFGVKGKIFSDHTNAGQVYEIYLPDGDKKGPPVGYVQLSKEVTSKVYDHEIQVVQGVEKDTKTGRYRILAKSYYILKDGQGIWLNKPFALPITGGEAVVDPTIGEVVKNKFWVRPRGTLGLEVTWPNSKALGALLVYPFSFGSNPDLSEFRFIGVGVAGNQNGAYLSISPLVLNAHKGLKFLHNTYIGPVMNLDHGMNMSYGATIQLGL